MNIKPETPANTMKRNTTELTPHPLNADIYNGTADAKLIASIQDIGIIQPLIIDHQNRIISGHRRWDAARHLKLTEVPVELICTQDELEIETALIEANRQRVKTHEQESREAAQIYKIEQAKARRRQASGTLPAKSPEGVGDARDLAGQRLGICGK